MMYRRLRLPRWIQITQAVFMVYVRILFVICTRYFAKGRDKLIKQTGSAIYSNYNVTAQHNKASFVSRYIAQIGSSTQADGSPITYFPPKMKEPLKTLQERVFILFR